MRVLLPEHTTALLPLLITCPQTPGSTLTPHSTSCHVTYITMDQTCISLMENSPLVSSERLERERGRLYSCWDHLCFIQIYRSTGSTDQGSIWILCKQSKHTCTQTLKLYTKVIHSSFFLSKQQSKPLTRPLPFAWMDTVVDSHPVLSAPCLSASPVLTHLYCTSRPSPTCFDASYLPFHICFMENCCNFHRNHWRTKQNATTLSETVMHTDVDTNVIRNVMTQQQPARFHLLNGSAVTGFSVSAAESITLPLMWTQCFAVLSCWPCRKQAYSGMAASTMAQPS